MRAARAVIGADEELSAALADLLLVDDTGGRGGTLHEVAGHACLAQSAYERHHRHDTRTAAHDHGTLGPGRDLPAMAGRSKKVGGRAHAKTGKALGALADHQVSKLHPASLRVLAGPGERQA